MYPNLPAQFLLKTNPVQARGGRFWAHVRACPGHGAEIRSPKSCDVAEWLAIQNNFAVHLSLFAQQLLVLPRQLTNTIPPPPENVTLDFQKEKENINKFSKPLIFSTDRSQLMWLQSVLKIRCKTSKLFALHASPCKGSKPRVYLDPFVFSTRYRWWFSDSTDHTSDF